MLRIGQGFDVHRLENDRRLIMCGVEIPYEKGLLGHSDADVAVHALADALLGALALGDIGQCFPDSDPRFKDADSLELLAGMRRVPPLSEVEINNIDVTIMAEAPKFAPYNQAMRRNLASALDIPLDRVSVKATTTEKLGFCGRGEGIAASAVVLLSDGA